MKTQERHYSVTELTFALNACVEEHFSRVPFVGEISQITRAASGHLYFTLKDEQSQVQAAMWRSSASRLSFRPEQGDEVLCSGTANLYGRSGRFQMIVHKMVPLGEGDLRRRFLMLKKRLEKEGLFDDSRKRPLPFFPKAVGVVTSSTGAVIHDIMVKIKERMPSMPVYLIGVRVQGEGAAQEIAAAVRQFNRMQTVDVLIVGRGGGSLEDLWPFNEEDVVRALFASRIPIVSGVGHETDTSLSDLVADRRAPTPTAAAEMVVPHREQLLQQLAEYSRRLHDTERWFEPRYQTLDDLADALRRCVTQYCETRKWKLRELEAKVEQINPEEILRRMTATVCLREERLNSVIGSYLSQRARRLTLGEGRLLSASPARKIELLNATTKQMQQRFLSSVEQVLERKGTVLNLLAGRLEALSPHGVLLRGYSYVKRGDEIVRESGQLQQQDEVEVILSKGTFVARVQSIQEE